MNQLLLTPDEFIFDEAGGKYTGKIDNAAEGLTLQGDGTRVWAWNPLMSQWQVVHILKSGQTLWWLAGYFYNGANNRWKEIRDVPQNKMIVGSDGAQAFAGDTILIPNLPQPTFAAPPATPPTAALPVPPGPEPVATLPGQPPSMPTAAPPGWPAGWPWPPTGLPPELAGGAVPVPVVEPPEVPPTPPPPPPIPPGIPVTYTPPTGAQPTTPNGAAPGEEKFWTTGKIVVAGALGLGGVGLILFLATRKPRRRRK